MLIICIFGRLTLNYYLWLMTFRYLACRLSENIPNPVCRNKNKNKPTNSCSVGNSEATHDMLIVVSVSIFNRFEITLSVGTFGMGKNIEIHGFNACHK